MFGIGFILSGLATAPWMLYITYGVITGIGQGIVYSSTIGNSVKLFPDKEVWQRGSLQPDMAAAPSLSLLSLMR